MKQPEFLTLFCSAPSLEVAEQLAKSIVEQRLAACVSLNPGTTSVYRWQGEICLESEVQMMIKTTQACYPALQDHILQQHPYEVPELLALPVVEGSEAYLNWLKQETK